METNLDPEEYLNHLLKLSSRQKFWLIATALLTFSVIGIPFAIATLIMYQLGKRKLKQSLHGAKIKEYATRRRAFILGVMEREDRIEKWSDRLEELKYQLECLNNKWGLPIYFREDSVLCELHIESNAAPKGLIAGATAIFADNTSTQMVTTGATSNTSYTHHSDYSGHIDYNRLRSSTTTTNYLMTPVYSGSASVQISGPNLIPGVLLFQTASEAQYYTNMFNAAASSTKDATRNIQSNIEEITNTLVEHEALGRGDFGEDSLFSSLNDLPSDVRSWVRNTAESQRKFMKFTSAMETVAGKGTTPAGTITKALLVTAVEQKLKQKGHLKP